MRGASETQCMEYMFDKWTLQCFILMKIGNGTNVTLEDDADHFSAGFLSEVEEARK